MNAQLDAASFPANGLPHAAATASQFARDVGAGDQVSNVSRR
jgi:hypothetical protein